MLISQSRARAASPHRLLGRTIPASEWLAGGGGRVLPALAGVAERQMGRRVEGLGVLPEPAFPRYLLRPKAVVSRARMVRLSVCWKYISRCANAARAWELVTRFFPETVGDYSPGSLALDILPGFLKDVEKAGWFEIEWQTLDWLWEIIMNGEDEDQEPWAQDFGEPPAQGAILACLYHIPVKKYNFHDEAWLNMEENLLLPAIKSVVQPGEALDFGYLPVDAHLFRERCQAVADERRNSFGRHASEGPPLDILPVMVDFVLRQTGNDLLDNHSAGYGWDIEWPYDLGYRWDSAEDVETLKQLSAEARPIWERIERLCEWAEEEEVMDALIMKIMGEGSYLEEYEKETEDND